jgi:hypothetical protein
MSGDAADLAELSDSAADAGVDAAAASASASVASAEAAIEALGSDPDDVADRQNVQAYIESGGDGTVTIKNQTLKAALDNVIDTAQKSLDSINRAVQKFAPGFKLSKLNLDDNFNPDKVGKTAADANTSFFKKLGDAWDNLFKGKGKADADKVDKTADKTSDDTKRSRYKMIKRLIEVIALAGGVASAVFILKHIADGETGCYEIDITGGTGQTMLSCGNSDKTLQTNCTCDPTTKKAAALLSGPSPGPWWQSG